MAPAGPMLAGGSFQYIFVSYSMYRLSPWLRLKKFWLDHEWIGMLLVFTMSTLFYTLCTAAPSFADPDSFYHLKVTELLMQQRHALTEFPWLTFTTLAQHYVDHHFLYHVALIPFVTIFGSFVGMKVATVVFAAAAVTAFYALLRYSHVRYSILWTILLVCSYGFSFRMGLSKAPSVALFTIFVGYLFLIRNNWKGLLMLSFVFVWTYGGFIVLPVIATLYTIIGFFTDRPHWRMYRTNIIAVVGGTIAGLLIHPSFPQHFIVYWQQVIQIGVVNYQNVVSVGSEWYPLTIQDFVAEYAIVIGLTLLALIVFGATTPRQTVRSKTALVVYLLFFLATLKSRRYIEYTLPWAYISIASSMHDAGFLDALPQFFRTQFSRMKKNLFTQAVGVLILLFCGFSIPATIIASVQRVYDAHHKGIPFTQFDASGEWLRSHANKGDIVFHSDWDEFPILFYQVPRARYIVGLDPTFMYNADPELYTTWVNITKGDQTDHLFEDISQRFHARFVWVSADNKKMRTNIMRDKRFTLVYEDDETTIFRVPRNEKE